MSLKIRTASRDDLETIVEFNMALAWESEKKALDAAILRKGISAVFVDSSKGFYLLAEREGEVVGQIMLTFEWSDWRNGWFWWIQSVFVKETARRSGVFRVLYQEAVRMAEADPEVIGVRLYMDSENHRARSAYLALGMARTSYEMLELYPFANGDSAY